MYKTVPEAIDIFTRLPSTDIFHVVEKRHGRALTGTKWDIVLAILEDDARHNGDVAHYPVDDADVSAWAIVEFAYNVEPASHVYAL